MNFCTSQRPLDDLNDVVACDEAEQHRQAQRDGTLDEYPTKILEVFEKGFDWTAFSFVGAFRFVVASHAKRPPSSFGRIGRL
jgi:hypothetical protein